MNLRCSTIVNNVITLSLTIDTQATCDDLRNILYIGRPRSVPDQFSFCDIISENQSGDKRQCVMTCKCGPPADQCFFKFHTGPYEATVKICEITAS